MQCFTRTMAVAALATMAVVATFYPGASGAAEPEKYTLRYKFQPGETLRWDVEHRTNIRTSVSATTQTAETLSVSVKRWQLREVRADGAATFEHSVERVDMRQKLAGRSEVRYNSETDAKPPVGFEDVAKSVGVPLSIVTMDARGKVLHRQRRNAKTPAANDAAHDLAQNESAMTIPLPEEAIALGHTWSIPQDIDVPLESGGVKRVKALQQFMLEEVKTGVAMIRVSTEILTPITSPAIESQLVQREAAGQVRFDIDAGRILGQQLDIDKHVVGFRGDASSIHYVNRFSERLLPDSAKTAAKTIPHSEQPR
jgi:hypothetical protein